MGILKTAPKALLAFPLFLLLAGCAPRPATVVLAADPSLMPRLEALLGASPLPRGWSLAAAGDSGSAVIGLDGVGLREKPSPDRDAASPASRDDRSVSVPAGRRWLAPALNLADPRFSLAPSEAEALGLVPLEDILPPKRAPAVAGLWPGQKGYPFFEDLVFSVRSSRGTLPRALASWAARAGRAAAAAGERPFSLGAVGDIQVGPREGLLLISGERGITALFRDGLLQALRSEDFLVGNLEGQISARGKPNPRKHYLFKFPLGTAAALRSAGFGLLLLGNNHALDYGLDAFADTLGDFKAGRMLSVGAGMDTASAAGIRRVALPGTAAGLSFIGFASFPKERWGFTTEEAAAGKVRPGINADEAATLDAIRLAAGKGETVIVLTHGGNEYVPSPQSQTRELYRRFADAGAALVLGSHPHILQGIEARGRSIIAYSLGNFLFTGEAEPEEAKRSALVTFLLYRGVVRGFRLDPVLVGYDATSPDPDRSGAEAAFAKHCAQLQAQ